MIYSYNFYFDLKINNLGKWKLGVTNLVIDYLSEKMNLAMRIKSSINGWNWLLPLDKPRIQYKGSSEIFLWKLKETPHYLYPLCLFLFHPVTRRSHHHCQGKKKTSDMIVSWETYRRRIHVADNKIDFPSNTSTVIPRSGRNGWWSILLAILPIKWTTTPFEPPKGLPLNTRIFSLLVYVDLVCVVPRNVVQHILKRQILCITKQAMGTLQIVIRWIWIMCAIATTICIWSSE